MRVFRTVDQKLVEVGSVVESDLNDGKFDCYSVVRIHISDIDKTVIRLNPGEYVKTPGKYDGAMVIHVDDYYPPNLVSMPTTTVEELEVALNLKPGAISDKPKHDLAVLIGRFQPFHNGHLRVVKEALKLGDNLALLLGSADEPRALDNPLTYEEREGIIWEVLQESFSPADLSKIVLRPLFDEKYDEPLWHSNVRKQVDIACMTLARSGSFPNKPTIALVGHYKDSTSYYLKNFPEFASIEIPDTDGINATDIRNAWYETPVIFLNPLNVSEVPIASSTRHVMAIHFERSEWYNKLVAAKKYYYNYNAPWKLTPYPVNFVTVDVIIEHKDKILLVQRGDDPGKGQWAMAGGFVNPDETINVARTRELYEETGLDLNTVNYGVVYERIFDDPKRSKRGRIITHVAHILIDDDTFDHTLLKAGDDAANLKWVHRDQMKSMRGNMFDDHYHIVHAMLQGL